MTETDAKKYSLAEIVLFGILVAGVLLAWLTVRLKSDIVLSKPVAIQELGFSASLPAGAGWNADDVWQFKDNAYYISSWSGKNEQSPTSQVLIKFAVAESNDVDRQLLQRASQLGGSLGGVSTVMAGTAKMRIAEILVRGHQTAFYCGIASLGMSRIVKIEVIDNGGSAEWGHTLVTKIAAGFTYKQPAQLKAGSELIASIKKTGIAQWLKSMPRATYYFLGLNGDQYSGFLAELSQIQKDQANYGLHLVNAYFLRDGGGEESIFNTDEDLAQWVWVGNLLDAQGNRRRAVELYMASQGRLTIRHQGGLDVTYPSDASLPQMLVDAVFPKMVQNKVSVVLLDIVGSDGRIVPTRITLLASDKAGTKYTAIVEDLDGSNAKQTIVFDSSMKLKSSTITDHRKVDIEPASKDAVLSEFPIWNNYIEGLDKLLDSDSSSGPSKSRRVRSNGAVI